MCTPLLDADYHPYDIGVMGELDVRILTELFGGPDEAAKLTPQWNGGLYYAVQSRKAVTPEQQAATSSVALIYLSAWRSEGAAKEFATLYARELSKKYSGVVRDPRCGVISYRAGLQGERRAGADRAAGQRRCS